MAARKEVARNRRVVARTRSTRRSSPGAVVVLSRERNRCGSTVRRKRIPHVAVQSYRYSTGGRSQRAIGFAPYLGVTLEPPLADRPNPGGTRCPFVRTEWRGSPVPLDRMMCEGAGGLREGS